MDLHNLFFILWHPIAQSYPTLCDPMDCSPPGSSVHGDSPGKNTGVGCHALLQGIFPTQGSNPGLPHCRQIFYQLNHLKHIIQWKVQERQTYNQFYLSQAPRVPVQALPMVVPPQEPDKPPANVATTLPIRNKGQLYF